MYEKDQYLQIDELCRKLQLGDLTNVPDPISGGLLHKMFDVHTVKGRYAVKALNPLIMKRPPAKQNVIDSEIIASIAAEFIPAVAALRFNKNALQEHNNRYYLIFNWVDGKSLKQDEIKPEHCFKMGSLLGKLHRIDFSKSGIENQNSMDEKTIDWCGYLEKGREQKADWVGLLSDHIEKLHDWLNRYNLSSNKLMQNQIISHKDMDSKNVLWRNNEPIIIDWESAGYVNPTKDLIETALYYATDYNGKTDERKLDAFIDGYKLSAELIDTDWNAVLDNGLIGKLEWLEYSLKRSLKIECSDKDEQKIGTQQAIATLNDLIRYDTSIPQIRNWIEKGTRG